MNSTMLFSPSSFHVSPIGHKIASITSDEISVISDHRSFLPQRKEERMEIRKKKKEKKKEGKYVKFSPFQFSLIELFCFKLFNLLATLTFASNTSK